MADRDELMKKPVVVKPVDDLSDLVSVKGIGKKAVNDLKRQFSNRESLIRALKEDKVSLRDDQVEILKRELIK